MKIVWKFVLLLIGANFSTSTFYMSFIALLNIIWRFLHDGCEDHASVVAEILAFVWICVLLDSWRNRRVDCWKTITTRKIPLTLIDNLTHYLVLIRKFEYLSITGYSSRNATTLRCYYYYYCYFCHHQSWKGRCGPLIKARHETGRKLSKYPNI
jgi:hypothetical protein